MSSYAFSPCALQCVRLASFACRSSLLSIINPRMSVNRKFAAFRATVDQLFPDHGLVGRLDVGRETILTAPAGILGHLHFLLDVIERLASLHHRADPIEQQRIMLLAVLEDLDRAGRAVPRNTVFGVERLHHLAGGEYIRNGDEGTQDIDLVDDKG